MYLRVCVCECICVRMYVCMYVHMLKLLKSKPNLLFIWNQSVPRCKHSPPLL